MFQGITWQNFVRNSGPPKLFGLAINLEKDRYQKLKGALSGLRESLTFESPLKIAKSVFISS